MKSILNRWELSWPPSRKCLRTMLIALSAALLLVAGVILAYQWLEGTAANRNVQAWLNAATTVAATSASEYESKTSPAVSPATDSPTAVSPSAVSTTTPAPTLPFATDLHGFRVMARLDIAKLNLSLPVIAATSDQALKQSICYYTGPEPGGAGNLVLTGHNYRNGAHFGRLDEMAVGDRVAITVLSGRTYTYEIYALEIIKPDQPEALQKLAHTSELTLMTCTQDANRRLLVRCFLVS